MRLISHIHALFFVLVSYFPVPLCLNGAVVFSQLYDDGSYHQSSSWNVTGSSASLNDALVGYHSTGAPFILESDTILTSVDLALSYYPHSSSQNVLVSVRLSSPTTGLPFGEAISSGIVSAIPNDSSSTILTSFIPSDSQIMLNGGEIYWITAQPTDPLTYNGWNIISPFPYPLRGRLAGSSDGEAYYEIWSSDLPAFQISGTPIPEPTTALLLLFALTFSVICNYRNRTSAST